MDALVSRKNRFIPQRGESDVRGSKRALDALEVFNQARILPFNALHALVDPHGSYRGHRQLVSRMFDHRLLDLRTFDGSQNYYETMAVSRTFCAKKPTDRRTCCGFHFLEKYGRRAFNDLNTAQDEEQLLIDLVDVGFELGARGTDVEFHKWLDIVDHDATPKPLPANPFQFEIGTDPVTKKTFHLVIDGVAGYFKRNRFSQLYVKEIVRFNKSKTALKHKIKNYRAVEQRIKKAYGFETLMVLWVAAAETMEAAGTVEANILNLVREEFGVCKWMATHTMIDHIAYNANRNTSNERDRIHTPLIPLHLFNEPWKRAHPQRFSLKMLAEV